MATPTPTKILNPQPWEVSSAQKQYAQGFIDALRHIQQLENFKYDTNLVSPSLVAPILSTQSELLRSPLLSPTAPLDLQAVMQALGGNPLTPVCSAPSLLLSKNESSLVDSATTSASLTSTLSQLPPAFLQASSLPVLPSLAPSTTASTPSSSSSSSIPSSSTLPTNLSLPAPLPHFFKNNHQMMSAQLDLKPTPPPIVEMPVNREIKIEIPAPRAGSEDSMSSRSSSTGPSSSGARFHSSRDDPMDGIHVDEQERRKLERKRLRNRQAASKCRQKKLERIAELEIQANEEKLRSAALDGDLQRLRHCLEDLQKKVAYHQQKGCPSAYPRGNVKIGNGH
ncbi:unnamed protein product, partial [Mesorhabditis belari]|uniref:BZIP domain-containing protein n=1 Tax=Mesorhabditis belari TaxID=2138241 RepID=A0AAF3EES7_9BILA